MAEHPTPETLDRYHGGALTAEELLAVDDHLAECSSCRERGRSRVNVPAQALPAAMTGANGRGHVDYEILEAYVDGTIDPIQREIVDVHLADCRTCAEDLGDLRQARAAIDVGPAPAAEGLMTRWSSVWGRAAAVAGLAAAAAIIWLLAPAALRRNAPAPETARDERQPGGEAPGAPVLVASLRDGDAQIGVDRTGALSGGPADLSDRDRALVATALSRGRVDIPAAIVDLGARAGVLLGDVRDENELKPIAPVSTAVESDRPRFRWTAAPQATSYVVAVFDRDFTEVARSPALTTTEWTMTGPLARGVVYAWQITATTPSGSVQAPVPPAQPAQFRVVEAEVAADLARGRAQYASSHVMLGLLYARAGVIDDAVRELTAVKAGNPESAVAAAWLADVQRAR